MSVCGSNEPCDHVVQAMKLCPDHSKHYREVVDYEDTGDAFVADLLEGKVENVQVGLSWQTDCEWEGVCTLRVLSRLGTVGLLVADQSGASFLIPTTCVISYD